MNSKNFDFIPPETEAWFNEISTWLDRVCELVEDGEKEAALEGFAVLLELIENMTDEIVFADELGRWMITSRYDYEAVYQRLAEK